MAVVSGNDLHKVGRWFEMMGGWFVFISVHANIFVHVHAARRLLKGGVRCFSAGRGHKMARYSTLSGSVRSPFTLDAIRRQLEPLATQGHQSFVDFGHDVCGILFTLDTKIPSSRSSPVLVLGNHTRVSGNGRGHLHDGMAPDAHHTNGRCLRHRRRRMGQG